MRTLAVLACLFVLGVIVGFAGSAHGQPAEDLASTPIHGILIHGAANSDDGNFDLGYRFLAAPKLGLGVVATLGARPWDRTLHDQIRPNFFLIRKESRYFVSAGLDEAFELSPRFGAYASAAVAYTWGEFKGSERRPDDAWSPLAEAGLEFTLGRHDSAVWTLRIGYRYQDLVVAPESWGVIGFVAEL